MLLSGLFSLSFQLQNVPFDGHVDVVDVAIGEVGPNNVFVGLLLQIKRGAKLRLVKEFLEFRSVAKFGKGLAEDAIHLLAHAIHLLEHAVIPIIPAAGRRSG